MENNWKWVTGLFSLFLMLFIFLVQYLLTTERIQELAQQEPPDTDTLKRIVLISQELNNPFWKRVENGARDTALQYGWDLEYTGPLRMNSAEQARLLEKAIASKADGILVQGVNVPEYTQLIDRAVDEGIPVLTIDTDQPDSKRLAYIGSNNEQIGMKMGALIANAATEGGQIGVMIGSDQAVNQLQRLNGFRKAIDAYPELQIKDVRSSLISRLHAENAAYKMLSSFPDIQYLIGFSSLDGIGFMDAVERIYADNSKDMPRIFAFDDLPETLDGIRSGIIEATAVQEPYQMGRTAVSLLYHHFQGQAVPEQSFTNVSFLTKDQLPEQKEQ